MTKRMLIDTTHAEEIRVVVLSGNRLEEFDCDTSTKKQLKGNIYLAKITRVEPSLQAAFVDYGGDRHGFLAFNEIHPDYYQIPISDRQAIAKQEAEAEALAEADTPNDKAGTTTANGTAIEVVSGDEIDDINRRRVHPSRRYKIQEVVKRRQIMLVQVVKEERGTKGAALTTYVSLAGRYCVLMPNTARGGGISRKIVNPDDRKRLKAIAADLPMPEGIGVILRTAGMGRSKAEIKRDFNYLMKLWDNIRELTLKSIAPTLIHEEANLIHRSIRDLYTKDIEEVAVDGEHGYRMAKDFMRKLMPSHAKRVILYDDRIPLFHRFQVEGQLDAMHSPIARLKSGGYIVISPTEALVSIDVNSGRATRERNIEETAFKTNLEAAEEIARELRLRDLAGLVVIDFIDMEESKNVRTVERRFKEAMKHDRARIQMGHISAFGLLELSRQRLRPSLIEASSLACPNCGGTGHIRSTESTALHVLRAIEEEGIRERSHEISVHVPPAVALYILNQKRAMLRDIEDRYTMRVTFEGDDSLIPPDYRFERVKGRGGLDAEERTERSADEEDGAGNKRRRRRSKQHKDEESEIAEEAALTAAEEKAEEAPEAADEESEDDRAAEAVDEAPRKRRRRGKRGGRRHRAAAARDEAAAGQADLAAAEVVEVGEESAEPAPEPNGDDSVAREPEPRKRRTKAETEKPKRARRTRREAADTVASEPDPAAPDRSVTDTPEAAPEKPKRARRKKTEADPIAETESAAPLPTPMAESEPVPARSDPAPARPELRSAVPIELPVASPPKAVERPSADAEETPDEALPVAAGEQANETSVPARPKRGARRGWWQKFVE